MDRWNTLACIQFMLWLIYGRKWAFLVLLFLINCYRFLSATQFLWVFEVLSFQLSLYLSKYCILMMVYIIFSEHHCGRFAFFCARGNWIGFVSINSCEMRWLHFHSNSSSDEIYFWRALVYCIRFHPLVDSMIMITM